MPKDNLSEDKIEEFLHYSGQMSQAITDGLLSVKINNPAVKAKLENLRKNIEENVVFDRDEIARSLSSTNPPREPVKIDNETVKKLAQEAKRYLAEEGKN